MSQIQQTTYGSYKKGLSFYAPDPRFSSVKSRRNDEYVSRSSREVTLDSIMCINDQDNSDVFCLGVNGEYDADCYGCWSGCGHTVDYHKKNRIGVK